LEEALDLLFDRLLMMLMMYMNSVQLVRYMYMDNTRLIIYMCMVSI